jgi:DNA-directed RNA polymerase specialized sigma24 family protein
MTICKRNLASAKVSGAQTTRDDFCNIFKQDMQSLYLLSLLLTADHKLAEQCYAAGMEDCIEGNPVFKQWAQAWTRRAIIKHALTVVSPLRQQTEPSVDASHEADLHPELVRVMQLNPLERFVYVMSVLERYSDHECATLLNTTKDRVSDARTRALQRLSIRSGVNLAPVEIVGKLLNISNNVAQFQAKRS